VSGKRVPLTAQWLGLALIVGLLPARAEAHTALQSMGSFWAGVAHLLTSFDQVGFLLGLAIWTRFHEQRLDALVIAAAFVAVNAGAFIGAAFVQPNTFDLTGPLAALLIIVGAAGAARLRTGAAALIGVTAIGGAMAGSVAADAAAGFTLALFAAGGGLAASAVLSYGLLAMRRVEVEWGYIALRAGSSWVAAIGLMVLALAIARHFGRV